MPNQALVTRIMTAEEDDLRALKEMVARLALDARSRGKSGMQLIDELSLQFEEYVDRVDLAERDPISGRSGQPAFRGGIGRAIARLVYASKYGTLPLPDRLTEFFQADLERQRRVNQGQRRMLNIHRMITFAGDGECRVELAPKSAYRQARIALAVISGLVAAALALVWTTLSEWVLGIPVSVLLGAALGWLWRDSIESAWGRDALARKLAKELPWMRICRPKWASDSGPKRWVEVSWAGLPCARRLAPRA